MALPLPQLGQADYKVLEQSRQKLFQLTNNLGALQRSIQLGDPLPQWSSLQSSAAIVAQSLKNVSDQLSDQHELLSTILVHPLPNFPGRTQEGLLGQLLRKKLEPHVESWVQQGRDTALLAEAASAAARTNEHGAGGSIAANKNNNNDDDGDDAARQRRHHEMLELWDWAGLAANQEARKRPWGRNFTLEELQAGVRNVVTGLRRNLAEEEEDDEDDDDDEEEGEGSADVTMRPPPANTMSQPLPAAPAAQLPPPLPLNDILRFIGTGRDPPRQR